MWMSASSARRPQPRSAAFGGTGTAAIVEDKEEKRTALDAITVRYKSLCPRPAPDSMINRVAIIRIDIDSLMGKYAPGEEEALKA